LINVITTGAREILLKIIVCAIEKKKIDTGLFLTSPEYLFYLLYLFFDHHRVFICLGYISMEFQPMRFQPTTGAYSFPDKDMINDAVDCCFTRNIPSFKIVYFTLATIYHFRTDHCFKHVDAE
jgi:hypothetical protein